MAKSNSQTMHANFVDADAVCETCATVNPEGTVICRQCGNNLRDQRSRRVVQADIVVADLEGQRKLRLLTALLPIVGILAVVWMAINAETVAKRLAGIDDTSPSEASAFWRGLDGQFCDSLLSELEARTLSESDFEAMGQPISEDAELEGFYALRSSTTGPVQETIVGKAIVRQRDGRYVFVATLEGVELRGTIAFEGTRPTSTDVGVSRNDRRYETAFGFAQRSDQGYFACIGQSDGAQVNLTAYAYKLP